MAGPKTLIRIDAEGGRPPGGSRIFSPRFPRKSVRTHIREIYTLHTAVAAATCTATGGGGIVATPGRRRNRSPVWNVEISLLPSLELKIRPKFPSVRRIPNVRARATEATLGAGNEIRREIKFWLI